MANQNKARAFCMIDFTQGGVKNIHSSELANAVRKSSSRVLDVSTPTKVCKRGRKPKRDIQKKKNSSCRFCGVNFTSGGRRALFENLFSPSGREESVELILAECFGSIGFPLTRDETFQSGSVDLAVAKYEMQLNCTVLLSKLYAAQESLMKI